MIALLQTIICAYRRRPMHAKHGASEDDGAKSPLPPRIRPGGTKNKKHRQRYNAGNDSDDRRPYDIPNVKNASIVRDTSLAKIMHPADGQSGKRPSYRDANDADSVVRPEDYKSNQEYCDRNEEGYGCICGTVCDLYRKFGIPKYNRTVADVVHAPNGNASHRDRRAAEKIPVESRQLSLTAGLARLNLPIIHASPRGSAV